MKFKLFEPHKNAPVEQQRESEEKIKRTRVAPEVEPTTQESTHQKSSIPLEWRTLAPLIEAHQSRKPTEEYLNSFWNRLRPRLKRAIQQHELVQQYLRETFWRRWTLRAATAAILLALAISWNIQRHQIDQLQTQIQQLQQQIQPSKAGM